MKHTAKLSIVLLTILSSFLSLSAQDVSVPIYASATIENNATIEKVSSTPAITDTRALQELSEQLRDKVQFPFEESIVRNKLQILVEVQIDELGKIRKSYVHHTDNQSVKKSIRKSLKDLGKVSPVIINGQQVAKTLLVPITFTY